MIKKKVNSVSPEVQEIRARLMKEIVSSREPWLFLLKDKLFLAQEDREISEAIRFFLPILVERLSDEDMDRLGILSWKGGTVIARNDLREVTDKRIISFDSMMKIESCVVEHARRSMLRLTGDTTAIVSDCMVQVMDRVTCKAIGSQVRLYGCSELVTTCCSVFVDPESEGVVKLKDSEIKGLWDPGKLEVLRLNKETREYEPVAHPLS